MNTVIVITSKPDPHIEMLEKKVSNVHFLIIDPKEFPNISMSFLTEQKMDRVIINGVDVTEVKVVWFRKPRFLKVEEVPVADNYKETVHENYVAFIKWVYTLFPKALWISDPWKILRGNSKPYQMQLARQLNFKLPATLLTSDATEAEKFVNRFERVVVKPLRPPAVFEDGTYKTMYTTRLDKLGVTYKGLNLTPTIFQEEIVGDDIRVTVVGSSVFACRIGKTGSISEEVDWRLHQLGDELVYKVDTDFPQELSEMCIDMVKKMGLVFGAFDFIEAKGNYYFLEINPNGQWGFIEDKCGLEISKAFAKMIVEALEK